MKGPKKIISVLFALTLCFNATIIFAQAPVWTWANGVYDNVDEYAIDVAVDPVSGNIITVGVFNSDLSAFYGPKFVAANGGGFVVKQDPNGNVLWAFTVGNNKDDACNGVAIDVAGNIYVTGYVQNVADVKGMLSGAPIYITSAGGKDIFIAKYNSAGQLLWSNTAGGGNDDEGTDVCVNASGAYITGYFNGSSSFGSLVITGAGVNDNSFVAGYNTSTGTELWVAASGAINASAYGHAICADNTDLYVIGEFTGINLNVTNSSGALQTTLVSANSASNDIFVTSYSNSGAFNWAKAVQSAGSDYGHGIAQNGASVYISGATSSSANFPGYASNPVAVGASGLDMFVAQLKKTNGTAQWVNSETGLGNQDGMNLTVNSLNAIYVTGYFYNTMNFPGGTTINSAGMQDVFLAVYDTLGNFQWVNKGGSSKTDFALSVGSNSTGEVYIAGAYTDNAVFTPFTLNRVDVFTLNILTAKIGCTTITSNTVSSTQTICTGQTPATLTGTNPQGGMPAYNYLWQQSPDNISWAFATGTNTVSTYSPPSISSNTYYRRVVKSFGGCTSTDTSASILITVTSPPTTAAAGIDSTVCATTINLWGNAPAVGSGTWTLVSGSGVITSVNLPTTNVSALGTGNNIFAWSISNGGCPASSDTVSVTVNLPPTAALAGADQNICSTTYTLNANLPVSGTALWSVIAGSSTVTSTANPNSPANGLSAGVNTFVWTITTTCASSSDTVSITVDAMPGASIAGGDQTICASSYILNATAPSVGTGNWNVLAGSSTVSNPLQNNSSATGLTVGVNSFEWVVSNGTCPSSRDTVTISVDAPPTMAYAGADQAICSSSYTLNANPATVGTGTWTVYSGGSTVTSVNSPNSPANNLSTGQNIFTWTTSNGVCPSSTDSVRIQVDVMPSVSFAGNPQTLCNDSGYLNAGVPTVGTGTWSVVSGGSTVSNAAQNNSLVYNLAAGVNTFMWSVGNGVCPVSTSTVNINVDSPPTAAYAGPDQTICSSTITLVATGPTTGFGSWTVVYGGSSLVAPNANTTSVNNLAVGINTFEWVTTNGTCPASRDTIQITVDASPSASNAGNDQTLCASSTVLAALVPPVGAGTWNVLSGGGTVQSPSQNNSNVNNLTIGINSFEWVVSNGTCSPTRDTVKITVDANPATPNAGSDQSVCATTATVSAMPPAIGNGVWTVVTGTANVNSPTQNTSPVNSLSVGQNVFVWTVTNGACPSVTDTVVITQDAMPSLANAGVSQNVCSAATNLNAVNPAVGVGAWTVVQGGAAVSSSTSNTSGVTGLTNGINIFQWTVSNGNCPSNNDTVVINYNYAPTVSNAGADQIICAPSSVLSANIPAVGNGSWTVLLGGGTVGSINSPSSSVTNLNVGQNSFIWTITNGVCPSSSDTVNITVSQKPSVAMAGSDQTICINSPTAVLAAQQPAVGNGVWTQIAGSGVVVNPLQVNTAVTGLAMGQNTFVWTVSNGVCPSSTDTVNAVVFPNPTVANAGIDQNIDGGTANLSANTANVGVGIWSLVSGSGSFANAASPGTQVTGLNIGDNVFGWTISNGVCPDSYDEVLIHVRDLTVPNGFSPNGDHVNDYFEIPGLDLFTNIKLEVFNRWGNLVYENDNYKNDWDGKNLTGEELTDDTYYFTMVVTKAKVYKGFVVLKRK